MEEALEMVKSGRVDVFSIDVGRLVAEVREAGSIEEWGEKLSKLIDLLWLKLDALARKVFGLGGRVDSTVRVNRQVTVPWFSLRDLKEALRKLREASSKRGREEGEEGVEGEVDRLGERERLLLTLRGRRFQSMVLMAVKGKGRVAVEELLEGDALTRVSIFVEVLRLISEGELKYDKDRREVYV